jgi:hypothetical protein
MGPGTLVPVTPPHTRPGHLLQRQVFKLPVSKPCVQCHLIVIPMRHYTTAALLQGSRSYGLASRASYVF